MSELKKQFIETVGEAAMELAIKLAEKHGIFKAAQETIDEFVELFDSGSLDSDDLMVEAKKKKDRKKTDKQIDEVKDMAEKIKKSPDSDKVDNPWALSNWMQNKGYDIKGKGKKKKSTAGVAGIIIRKAADNKKSGE